MFIFLSLWQFFWCFISSLRKKNLQMQIWLCFKSVLCCFAVIFKKWLCFFSQPHTHLHLMRVDKPLIHSSTVLFPFILVSPHSATNKQRKLPPEYFLTENNLIVWLWCLMMKRVSLWTRLCFSLCPVTSVTFRKTSYCIKFLSTVYSMWIDHEKKRYVPVRLSTVCVDLCVCVLSCASIAIHVVLGLGQYYISTTIAFSTAPWIM